jgi:hypothetical protein
MNPAQPDSAKAVVSVLDEMANLLAQHKLVPFFGAGISRQHLGLAAAELAAEMAQQIGAVPETLLSDVADQFADKFGEKAFVDFLRSKLVVPQLDESKAPAHRLLLSLSLNLLYTTNQDNLFELVAQHYGRPYRRIVTLQDISDSPPGERRLIKFHGDTDVPESLVFSTKSYKKRMATNDNPLDIRLRSDLLGKQLLFLGYSFKDENVAKLLAYIQQVFAGHMPTSYLVAFEYDSSMEELAKKYGIRVIDPRQFVPDAKATADAFERFLKMLCDQTVVVQAQRGLDNLFSGGTINPRVVTDYEVNAVERAVETETFKVVLDAFVGAIGHSRVPESLQRRVTNAFTRLVARTDPANAEEMRALKAALFGLHLPPALAAEATAYIMAACNRRPMQDGFDEFISLACPALPDGANPVAAAMAVAILRERGEAITEGFRRLAQFWFEGSDEVPEQVRDNVRAMIQEAWSGSGGEYRPIHRPGFLPRKGFHQILDGLMAQMPKQFRLPEE